MAHLDAIPLAERCWPEGGATRVPFWAYSDPEVYQREIERIFLPLRCQAKSRRRLGQAKLRSDWA